MGSGTTVTDCDRRFGGASVTPSAGGALGWPGISADPRSLGGAPGSGASGGSSGGTSVGGRTTGGGSSDPVGFPSTGRTSASGVPLIVSSAGPVEEGARVLEVESAISRRIISSRAADSNGVDTGRSAAAPCAEVALALPLPAAAMPPTAVGKFPRGRAPSTERRGHDNPAASGDRSDPCRDDDEESIGSSDGSKSATVSSSGGVAGVPTAPPRESTGRRVTSKEGRSAGSGDSPGRDAVGSEMRSRRTNTASSGRLTSPRKAPVGPTMDADTTRTNRNVQIHRRRSNACQPWVLIGHVPVQCSHLGPRQSGGASPRRPQTFGSQHEDYLLPRLWKEADLRRSAPHGSLLCACSKRTDAACGRKRCADSIDTGLGLGGCAVDRHDAARQHTDNGCALPCSRGQLRHVHLRFLFTDE